MDSTVNGSRRRKRSQAGLEKDDVGFFRDAIPSRQPHRNTRDLGEEHKRPTTSADHHHASDGSSRSTSQEWELFSVSNDEGLTDDEETGLTKIDKGRRRRRKRRNTLLDERIAGDTKGSRKERKMADMSVLKSSAINAVLIGLWFVYTEASGYPAE